MIEHTIHSNLPSLTTDQSNCIQISNPYSSREDYRIGLDPDFLAGIAMIMVKQIIMELQQKHPELDFDKLQGMYNSSDPEMKNYLESTLGAYTYEPIIHMLDAIRIRSTYSIINYITDYGYKIDLLKK